jgi:hypothetical protein
MVDNFPTVHPAKCGHDFNAFVQLSSAAHKGLALCDYRIAGTASGL